MVVDLFNLYLTFCFAFPEMSSMPDKELLISQWMMMMMVVEERTLAWGGGVVSTWSLMLAVQ